MDCKKTIIDYLEGRIKPAELEELFETHPELLDWVQSIVPEDQRMEAGEFVNGHYESRTVPFDIRLFIKQEKTMFGGKGEYSLGVRVDIFSVISRLVKAAFPDMKINLTEEVNEMHGLSLDACPSYIGGVEVTETIENIIRELPENLSKSKRIALARSRIKDAFHIEGRKWPYWIQEPDWPANNGKPMKYVSTVRLNADQREHHFVDVDTGEERIVMDCT